MTASPSETTPSSQRPSDLLPNEREITYDRLHVFFDQYKYGIITGFVFLVLASLGFALWKIQKDKNEEIANERFAMAHTIEEWKSVIQSFPGSQAALLSEYSIASRAFDEGKWDVATETYQKILSQYPPSFLTPTAIIGKAAVQEATGKFEDAIKIYQSVKEFDSKCFQAPMAMFSAARLMENSQMKDAQKAYENLITEYPESAWAEEAKERLKKIGKIAENPSSPPATTPAKPQAEETPAVNPSPKAK